LWATQAKSSQRASLKQISGARFAALAAAERRYAVPTEQIEWSDRAGVRHQFRLAPDLSANERRLLDILHQQTGIVTFLLQHEYLPPVNSQAPPNMLRLMLRILLPNVDNEEIATFDLTTANDLLNQWWATQLASP
jgi:hypothetical protein